MFEDAACKGCDYRPDRPSDMCHECELGGLKEIIQTWSKRKIKGKLHASFPIGDRENMPSKLGIRFRDFKIVDKRTAVKFDFDVKLTAKLRDYQIQPVDTLVEEGYGVLKSPPRTGKTVMTLAAAIELGLRVVIIADQKDFLDNFYETLEEFSNLPDLEEEHDMKLFGFLKKKEDYDNFQIGLATYQSFISKVQGPKRIAQLNSNFSTFVIDECQRGNAHEYSHLLSRLSQKHKFGCSATPKRKDGKEFLVQEFIGPVKASSTIDTLKPKLMVIDTGCNPKRTWSGGPAAWVYACQWLANSKKRNDLIFKCLVRDIKAGRSIVLPLMYKNHITKIVKAINEYFYDDFDRNIAAAFEGGAQSKKLRKEIINKARSREIRLVVGVRSLMQLGLNVPVWDCVIGSTLIPTDRGLFKIEDMCPKKGMVRSDQSIYDGKGFAKTQIAGHMGKKIVREITTNSGFQLTGSLNQKVMRLTPNLEMEMTALKDLTVDDIIPMSQSGNTLDSYMLIPFDGGFIPLNEKLAYLIGAMRGDGSVKTTKSGAWYCRFHNTDKRHINTVKKIATSIFGACALTGTRERPSRDKTEYELRFSKKVFELFSALGLLGASYEKDIPSCIMQSPKKVQLAYMAGELDTDGFLSSSQNRTTLGFSSSCFAFIQQMQMMVYHSFGIVLKFNPLATTSLSGNIKANRPMYSLGIVGEEAVKLIPMLKRSNKAKSFQTIHKPSSKTPRTQHIPFLTNFLNKIKSPNGVYRDAETGERLSIPLQKLGMNASIKFWRKHDAVNLIARAFPEEGAILKKLFQYADTFERVIFTQESEEEIDTYDFAMADSSHPYFSANGFVIHNCLYYAMPMSNKYNWEQESCRILTPHDNKMRPTIRMFVDPEHGQSAGCFKQTWRFSMELGYQPTSNAKRMYKEITGESPDRWNRTDRGATDGKFTKRSRASEGRESGSDGGLFGRGGTGISLSDL